jgi:hypothetical protein
MTSSPQSIPSPEVIGCDEEKSRVFAESVDCVAKNRDLEDEKQDTYESQAASEQSLREQRAAVAAAQRDAEVACDSEEEVYSGEVRRMVSLCDCGMRE